MRSTIQMRAAELVKLTLRGRFGAGSLFPMGGNPRRITPRSATLRADGCTYSAVVPRSEARWFFLDGKRRATPVDATGCVTSGVTRAAMTVRRQRLTRRDPTYR